MTREEAIGYLKGADVTVGREPKTKTAEALEMAIKALEQTRWIPVSERLPEIKQHVLLSCYGRVIYGRMISEDGNSGYPVFEICDSVGEKRPIVLETTVHSEWTTSRIKAWMPLPEPYREDDKTDG